ncbi:MAG: hypothetical protein R1F52_04250 [Candidatus Nitrosoabyssus spongiisocia]|nr:MAG: hypothetical protein R1F52_04250 [Nitrosopumilaceae archaeon AB1(1)]
MLRKTINNRPDFKIINSYTNKCDIKNSKQAYVITVKLARGKSPKQALKKIFGRYEAVPVDNEKEFWTTLPETKFEKFSSFALDRIWTILGIYGATVGVNITVKYLEKTISWGDILIAIITPASTVIVYLALGYSKAYRRY